MIEHMQVPMFETHHSIYSHKYLNMFDHQQPHPVQSKHEVIIHTTDQKMESEIESRYEYSTRVSTQEWLQPPVQDPFLRKTGMKTNRREDT